MRAPSAAASAPARPGRSARACTSAAGSLRAGAAVGGAEAALQVRTSHAPARALAAARRTATMSDS